MKRIYTKRKDSDDNKIYVGDKLRSSYGIPGREIIGTVEQRFDGFYVLTPGHNPEEMRLGSFIYHLMEIRVIND